MAGVTGIATGNDYSSLISSIVALEKAPKQTQLDTLEKNATTKLTSLGSLKSAISAFQTALSTLNSPSSFLARTAKSSDDSVFKATASQSAAAGSYQIQVSQLAASSKVALQSIANSADAKFNSGKMSISLGDTEVLDLQIDSSNNTLGGVRDAINKQSSTSGVTATIVTDSSGSRLVLNSTKSGDGKDIKVAISGEGSDGDTSLSKLAFDPSTAKSLASLTDAEKAAGLGGYVTKAQSAKLTVDGLSVVSDTNTVTSAIEGVSINLTKVTAADTPVTLTVARDEAGVKANVQKFVDAYNTLISFTNTQTKVTSVGDDKTPVTGALVGDSSVRSLLSAVRSEITTPGEGGSTYNTLASLGITTDPKDGTLKINDDKLTKAVSTDFEGVAAYFTGDNGLASRLTTRLKPYTDSAGILDQRTDMLQKTISSVDKQQKDLDTRIAALQDRLNKQFSAMDNLVAQLSKTGDQLLSQLNSMPFANKS
ncbi:flagellar filament capping protein FliD [Pseudomonas nitroreducens]|uniref:flagellar filament capping protein FliD n=1 Tax=Pseudomonas nitroreducens TaxID=46680 RepID=UPI00265816C9|nr:flagellar filament capping protein FliD [Pseudomonas nitroreducens]MCP1651235.1 flagellar hook-associated protein 2 [Pseudomonas nitroreducens]MCP1684240.1 flagellar hook-associated protein 2 [Pseudomonas nitroreducens]